MGDVVDQVELISRYPTDGLRISEVVAGIFVPGQLVAPPDPRQPISLLWATPCTGSASACRPRSPTIRSLMTSPSPIPFFSSRGLGGGLPCPLWEPAAFPAGTACIRKGLSFVPRLR